MKLTNTERIIIDEFKIFGSRDHPGCSPRLENYAIYRQIKEHLMLRQSVDMTVEEIERKWKTMKEWWKNHQKNVKHDSYRGERREYQCPIDSELCARLAFISVCECYRHLYEKHQEEIVSQKSNIPIIIID